MTCSLAPCSGLDIILKYRTPPPTLKTRKSIKVVLFHFDILKWSHNKQIRLAVRHRFDWEVFLFHFEGIWNEARRSREKGNLIMSFIKSNDCFLAGRQNKNKKNIYICRSDLFTLLVHDCFAVPGKLSGWVVRVKLLFGCCNTETLISLATERPRTLLPSSSWVRPLREIDFRQTETIKSHSPDKAALDIKISNSST